MAAQAHLKLGEVSAESGTDKQIWVVGTFMVCSLRAEK